MHSSATTTLAKISGIFGRGSPASSSTSLSPWTLGSHSFEDGACRTTRRWRVVLAPKLAVRREGKAGLDWEQRLDGAVHLHGDPQG